MELWAGVVLAAGKGVRMKSGIPKVLHKMCGRELVFYPVEALRQAGVARIVVVVSPENELEVKDLLGDTVEYALQDRPRGTGHALLQAAELLNGEAEQILVMGADSPLIRPATLRALSSHHLAQDSYMTLLSATWRGQKGMGQIVRDGGGKVVNLVEALDSKDVEEGELEVNAGVYCFKGSWLWDNLSRIEESHATREIYLTSLVSTATSQGAVVDAVIAEDPQDVLGINDRIQLAEAEGVMRRRIRERWMREGVTMLDPASTFLDEAVELGQDTVIYPNTMVLGSSKIGSRCKIGPNSVVRDSMIGDGCKVVASFVEEATIETSVDIGPFSHLRPAAYLESGVHVGNFAEIKNTRMARGAVMGHFGYLGDASIGAEANLGAGMVTCNYDGVEKHRTVVEEGAFIGCDTMLVAPVTVGAGAVTGAGAVVTKDVPAYRLAVGVPATIKPRGKAQT